MLLQPEYVTTTGPNLPNFYLLASLDEWAGARDALEVADRDALKRNDVNDLRHTMIWPWLAYAWARTGRLADAEALIARTPHDCTLCLEMRGRIAEIKGDTAGAAQWYGRAVSNAPSLPFSVTDWGDMLLRHGDLAGAIAKYQSANHKSPHFADPLEMWGEALIAQNRSDLALAKFEEANRYAPNWKRLHQKWGEALKWSGDHEGAKKQFALARSLDG
jgi:tetratricopeptide (TPR) repeat protein